MILGFFDANPSFSNAWTTEWTEAAPSDPTSINFSVNDDASFKVVGLDEKAFFFSKATTIFLACSADPAVLQ
jgi:hypothetical protein